MNQDFHRTFNGVELTGRKRLSNHWLMNTSFAYNSTIVNYGVGGFQDPTNIVARSGFLSHVHASGAPTAGGVWLSEKTAQDLGVEAGQDVRFRSGSDSAVAPVAGDGVSRVLSIAGSGPSRFLKIRDGKGQNGR